MTVPALRVASVTTSVPCPSCSSKLRLPDSSFGKPVTCPKCGARVTVPGPDEFERVAELPAPRRARPPTRSVPDDAPRPRRVARRGSGRRRPSRRGGLPQWVVPAAVSVVLLVLMSAVAWVLLPGRQDGVSGVRAPAVAELIAPVIPAAPTGYSVAVSADGGYRVFLPGVVSETKFPQMRGAQVEIAGHAGASGDGTTVSIESRYRLGSSAPGTSVDELTALAKSEPKVAPAFNQIRLKPEVRPVTLGGRPGLMIRTRDNPQWLGGPAGPPAPAGSAVEQIRRNEAERVAKTGLTYVILFTTDGTRAYTITLEKPGDYFDDNTVRTVVESFTFL